MTSAAEEEREEMERQQWRWFIPISGIYKMLKYLWKKVGKKKALLLLTLLYPALAAAVPGPEFCGDLVDNLGTYTPPCPAGHQVSIDGLGCDTLCTGYADKDRDGENDVAFGGSDCDDSNGLIHSGTSVTCQVTSPNDGWKKCQPSGAYTSCTLSSSTPLAEGIRNFYFDYANGSNANACTYAAPCKSPLKFAYFYDSLDPEKPASQIAPTAGDYFYFKGNSSTPYLQSYTNDVFGAQAWMMRFANGTAANPIVFKNYPGHNPTFATTCDSTTQCASIYNLQSSYLIYQGLTIKNGYRAGFHTAETTFVTLKDSLVYDIHGNEDDNNACIYISGSDTTVLNTVFHDCYEPGPPSGGLDLNDVGMVSFGSARVVGKYLTGYATAPYTDTNSGHVCVKDKHGSNVGPWEVSYSTFWNCRWTGIGISSKNAKVYRNRIGNSEVGITSRDWGGPYYPDGAEVYNNTLVNVNTPFAYDSSSADIAVGTINLHHNIWNSTQAWGGQEQGNYVVCTYCADSLHASTLAGLTSDNNVWYNPNRANNQVDFFGANGGAYGVLGSVYTFLGWQGLSKDAASYNTTPGFDGLYRATATNTTDKGAMLLSEVVSGGGGGGGSGGFHKFDSLKGRRGDRRTNR